MNIGLIGKIYASLPDLAAGLRDAMPDARPIAIGSGSVEPFADAMAAWCYLHEENLEELDFLKNTGKPIVSRVEATVPHGVPAVLIDDTSAAEQLARHCIEQGAQMLFYTGVDAGFSRRRASGTEAAAKGSQLPFAAIDEPKVLLEQVLMASMSGKRPAVVCMNDNRAYQIQQALGTSEFRVPEHVLLCGFNNSPLADFPGAIPLTSVSLPDRVQGRALGEMIQQLNNGETLAEQARQLAVTGFHYRTSTGAYTFLSCKRN